MSLFLNVQPVYRAPSGPKARVALGVWGGAGAADTSMSSQPPAPPSCAPVPTGPLLTKVEVASLILGLEEAAPGLGVDISSLGHKQLHIVFAASLNGNVQGGLTWGGVGGQ